MLAEGLCPKGLTYSTQGIYWLKLHERNVMSQEIIVEDVDLKENFSPRGLAGECVHVYVTEKQNKRMPIIRTIIQLKLLKSLNS